MVRDTGDIVGEVEKAVESLGEAEEVNYGSIHLLVVQGRRLAGEA